MKKIIVLTIAFIATQLVSNAQNNTYTEKTSCSTPIEYNDYLVDMINLLDKVWTRALEEKELSAAMKVNTELKTLSGKMQKSLKKLQGFGGESAFKTAAINYVNHMNSVSKKELPAFLKILRTKGDFTTAMEKKAESYIPVLDGRREKLFAEFEAVQEKFAKEYGFTIEGK